MGEHQEDCPRERSAYEAGETLKVLKKDLENLRLELEQLSIDAYHSMTAIVSVYERCKRLQDRLSIYQGVSIKPTPVPPPAEKTTAESQHDSP